MKKLLLTLAAFLICVLPALAYTPTATYTPPLVYTPATNTLACPTCVTTGTSSPAVSLGTSLAAANPQRNGEVNTGLSTEASGTISFSSLGTEIVRVTGSGVAIGNPIPSLQNSSALQVNGIAEFGVAGSTLGKLLLAGNTSGFLTIQSQAAAGSPVWTAGTASGTPAVSATGPLSIATATGVISCSTCLTGNQTITLSGDVTGSGATAITTTVAKVNGVSYGTSPSTNTVAVVTGTNAATYEQVPNAALANPSTTVNGQTCTLGSSCTVTTNASAVSVGTTTINGGTNTYFFYDNAGVLGNVAPTGTGSVVLAVSPALTGTPTVPTASAGTNTTQAASTAFALNAARQYTITKITSSGNFTTPSTSTTSTIYHYYLWAGGGGGGSSNGAVAVGAGGGAGCKASGTFTGVAASTNVSITIGAAGSGGTASTGASGSNGGDTVIGSPVNVDCGGGQGGAGGGTAAGITSLAVSGGLGGTLQSGSPAISAPGMNGGHGIFLQNSFGAGGYGGYSDWGNPGNPQFNATAANPAAVATSGYGCGGGGGSGSGTTGQGQNGCPGFVIIEQVSP